MLSNLERVKATLTIAWAWRVLGLPGAPAKDCHSPFRQDKRPSFSVYASRDGDRYFDHATGEKGDVVDFWAKAREKSTAAALQDLLVYLPGYKEDKPPQATYKAKPDITWPADLRAPEEMDCLALGFLRSLNATAFTLAGKLGTLKIGTVKGQLCWILTDGAGTAAEARRMDGKPFGDAKSFALPGSIKSWPVGLETTNAQLNACKRILVVEGGPDYFAGLNLCQDADFRAVLKGSVKPVAMLGAMAPIGPEAAPWVEGAQILIVPHNDLAGRKAAERWESQLARLKAAEVWIQELPQDVKDLNESFSDDPEKSISLLKAFES